MAAGLASLFILSVIGAATTLVSLLIHPDPMAKDLLIYTLIGGAVTWLAALLKRRAVLCPLCKGTPLLSSRALTHSRAWRFRPFNHGFSAIISIIASQRFRCMYCASDFDLLKPRTRLRTSEEQDDETD